jgi:hypothetical protein
MATMTLAAALWVAGSLVTNAEEKMSPDAKPVLEETFDQDLANWVSEGPNSVAVKDGKLSIKTADKAMGNMSGTRRICPRISGWSMMLPL